MANELDNYERSTSPLSVLTPSEKRQLLEQGTNTTTDYPREATIHEVFQLQAAKTPHKIAIAYKSQAITYNELDKKSNQLAHFLRQNGVTKETLVALYLDGSTELIISILAILKAGGAYLPLDTSTPLTRIKTILEDSQSSILISQKYYLNTIESIGDNLRLIDIDAKAILEPFPNNYPPQCEISPDNLAYVMYTSGSTGRPKGVSVVHRGVIRLVKNNNYAIFNENEVILQLASIAFDAATFEIWQPLLNGGKLAFIPERRPSLQDIGKAIKQYNVTALWLTAGLFNLIVEEHIEYLKPLNKLLAGGDVLSISHVKKVLEELPHCQLINGYGPTENTTFTCCHTITKDDIKKASIPIGRPLANTQVYVLNKRLDMVPIGVIGELYIGGDGLARGYFNQPKLTEEKFIKNPFSNDPESRLYKTGDLVRWNEEGIIEFIGRTDFQVKIRGYRIELGEIETVLNQHPSVKISKVIAREDSPGNKKLVAYIIPSSSKTYIDKIYHKIRENLKQQLPDYMIPVAFITLDSFPLNRNGKIDYAAFPEPNFSSFRSNYVAPQTPTEEILTGIWSQVLKIENIGINDNFFELGGQSLLATQVVSRIRETLNIEIQISLLFEYPTIAELAQNIPLKKARNNDLLIPEIKLRNQKENLVLSFAQQRLWFLSQLEPNNTAYNLVYRFRIQGLLNINALEKSLAEVKKRHEILRTNFMSVNGKPNQKINNNGRLKLPIIDLQTLSNKEREKEVEKIVKQELDYPFNLSKDNLFRVQLIRLNIQEYQLLFNIHHIIFDGWSFRLLFSELKSLYTAYCQGLSSPLPSLPIQYADYTLWQTKYLSREVLEPQLNYWKQQLGGSLPILEFPTRQTPPKIKTDKGATKTFTLSSELTRKIKAFSQEKGVTIFMTLVATLKVLLGRYSRQEDVIVGTVISGRKPREIENLMGFFVNTLALRSHLSHHLNFAEFLTQVKQVCLDAYGNQDVPFEQLVEVLQPKRNLSHSPIFQVMFVLQNTAMDELQLPNLTVTNVETSRTTAKFELTLSMEERQEQLRGEWEYNTDLFDSSTIERMTEHFKILLSKILTTPQEKIWQLSLLTKQEKQKLLVEWTHTKTDYPRESSLHELFQQQAIKTPNKIAIAYKDQAITYSDLDKKSNQLAHYLLKCGLKKETLVALYLDRSPDLIVAILGILKAGGAYLPLDTSTPLTRVNTILEESKTTIIITQKPYLSTIEEIGENLNPIVIDNLDILENLSDNYVSKYEIKGDNLAYVMYTSGSTGKPKGVAVVHRGVVRLVKNNNYASFSDNEVILQLASVAFDAATFEIWQPLLNGGKLVLLPEKKPSLQDIGQAIKQYDVTTLWLTSGLFNLMVEEQIDYLKPLTKLLAGGDILSIPHVKRVLEELPHCQLINGYGPTENTTFTCCHTITKDDTKKASIPIGRPLANTEVYILDESLAIVPIGVVGELYIGGDGLARGYLHNADLSEEKFIKNPFSNDQNARLYKTGDLVRWNKEGTIEFLGRTDFQVKIRGYRIEIGEIETVLNKHPMVKISKIVAKEYNSGQKRLIAYIILNSRENDTAKIRDYLKEQLPDYMIPAGFVVLDSFPLNPNGKIDYVALPEPDFSTLKSNYIAPRNATEEIIANIWKQILSVKNIGINDNFFELGGHSLVATQIISRIRDSLQIEIPLKLLFDCPTIAQISEHIEVNQNIQNSGSLPPIETRQKLQQLPLSFAQEGLWFLTQLEPNSTAYNMPFILEIKGSLNIVALEKSINKIIERHQILRSNFSSIDGQPTQIINKDINFKLSIDDLRNQKEKQTKKIINQLIERPFDLAKNILFCVKLLQLDENIYWLVFNIHHIIFDGWSYEILQKELFTLYQAYCQGKKPQLAQIPIQYADFSSWQRHWFTDENLNSQLNYWKEQLKGTLPILQLPTDFPRPSVQTYQADSYSWCLSSEVTTKIKSFCQQEEVTLFVTFLTVFKLLLSRYTAEKDIIVGTPIAYRNRTEIENLIGFFINTIALRTNLDENCTFQELLSRVRQVTLDAYTHQDVPFEKLVKELKPERSLSYNPIFQVWFNMINLPKNRIKCDSLQVKSIPVIETMAKFDLSLYVEEENQEIKLKFVYNNLLFKSSTIEGMSRHFQNLLEQVIITPENNLSSFFLLSEKERYQLTHQVNKVTPTNSFLNFPKTAIEQSIPSRFEEQVKKYPDKIAIQSKNYQYTYQQLNNQANKIAGFLLNITDHKQTKVALFFDHNVSMIAAIMGILKAGKIYVPLDPNYPQDRISYILEDSCAEVILTNHKNLCHLEAITHGKLPIINIDELNDVAITIKLEISSDTLAYILYTSGSTGKPKGVIQNHRNVLHFIRNYTNNLHISADDNLTLLASYSFDAAIIDIFSALLNGATLTLFDIKQEGLENLSNWLQSQKITIYHSTPTVYRYFLEILESKELLAKSQLSHIRLVILGGEPVAKKDVELYQRFFADYCLLVNGLGATECSFYLQYLLDKNTIVAQESVPVGYAFEDTEVILLDKNGNRTDICGEIAVRSPHIALGYWQKEDLTKAVFLEDFQGQNKRIYRTGDWGRLRSNGIIECLGRKDNQVKIRGFRVELGEIEALLNEYPQVKQTVVILRENNSGDKQLIAYIVPQDISLVSNSQPQIIQQLRNFLLQKLPNYMVPARFVLLETLPLTPNGKIDRRTLTSRKDSEPITPDTFIAPRNPLELQLTHIWRKVLAIESIGVNDNFFELGGHSLLAVRLVVEIEKALQQKLSLGTLFQCPTIEQLADIITSQESCAEAVWPMQCHGSRLPLFFVHVLGRGLKFCRPMVEHLDPDQPVYGLNAQMNRTQEPISNGVEDLATYYIEQMRMIQPQGPYLLAGISFGGKVAYEMAQQLQSQGETIALLALLDTYAPGAVEPITVSQKIHVYWSRFLDEGVPYLLNESLGKLTQITKNQLQGFIKFQKNVYLSLALKLNLSLSEQMQDFMFQQENRQASRMYIPKVYSGNVSLFVAQGEDVFLNAHVDPQLGWGNLVEGKLTIYEIPGTHLGMLQDPSAKILADKLTLAIENSTKP